jgi:RNA polymerase sigma factor (sigma-70 family)
MAFPLWFGGPPDAADPSSEARTGPPDASRVPSRDVSACHADAPLHADALISRVHQGDTEAFNQIYLDAVERLWRFAYRYVHSRELASDIIQDVFTSIWTRRTTWNPGISIDAYLFRAVRNRIISGHRHTSIVDRFVHDTELSPMSSPSDAAEHEDSDARVRQAIDALSERQRAAVLLRWDQGLNTVEIGAVLGITEAAVRKLLANAREQLRPALGGMLDP